MGDHALTSAGCDVSLYFCLVILISLPTPATYPQLELSETLVRSSDLAERERKEEMKSMGSI